LLDVRFPLLQCLCNRPECELANDEPKQQEYHRGPEQETEIGFDDGKICQKYHDELFCFVLTASDRLSRASYEGQAR
jgi:hypothetical protein